MNNESNRPAIKTSHIALIGVFTAVSSLLYMLEVPLFASVPAVAFLKINPADIGSLFISAAVSPVAGEIVLILRCLVHMAVTQTFGVGEVMDFLLGTTVIVAFWAFFLRRRGGDNPRTFSVRYTVMATAISAVIMAEVGTLGNFIAYPLYMGFMTNGGEAGAQNGFTMVYGILLFLILHNIARGVLDFVLMRLLLPTARKLRNHAW